MTLYILSLIPLLAAPLLLRGFSLFPQAARGLDSFVLVSVSGLIVLHILPHSLEHGGLAAVAALLVGLMVPFLAERFLHAEEQPKLSLPVLLGLVALAIHGMLDGLALAGSGQEQDAHGQLLAAAVLLHRLPAGLAVWWLVKPRFGKGGAWGVLFLLVLATTLGFAAPSLGLASVLLSDSWYVVQALLAGSLVHVVLHQSMGPSSPKASSTWQRSSLVGALCGVAALAAIEYLVPHGEGEEHSAVHEFAELFLLVAPPVVLAYLLAAAARLARPRDLARWLSARSKFVQMLRGVFSGVSLNLCSCGVAELYHKLIHRGAPPGAALALLVAAPELAVGSVLVSLRLLGVEVGLTRVLLALVLGLAVGLVLGGFARRHPVVEEPPAKREAWTTRLSTGFKFSFGELLDESLPWLVVGLLLAALANMLVEPEVVAAVPHWLHVPLMALLGAPFFVCAAGSTPLAAVLLMKGLSPGAAIAFLLMGPATNSAVWHQMEHLHGRKLAAAYTGFVLGSSILLGYLLDLVLHHEHVGHSHHGHEAVEAAGWIHGLELSSAVILGLLVLLSVARQGMPRFLGRVLTLHGHHHGDSHKCTHSH